MPTLNLKPTHKAVKAYFDELQAVAHLDFYDEGAVPPAFAELLRHCGRQSARFRPKTTHALQPKFLTHQTAMISISTNLNGFYK